MNTKNNRRRKHTCEKIEKIFTELLQSREIEQISVSEIVKLTGINRSTFYANYIDIYDLAEKLGESLTAQVNELYENDAINNCSNDYLRLFRHIKDNQLFYKTYFKLGHDKVNRFSVSAIKHENKIKDDGFLEYHIEFHKAGLNAIIKKWLYGGCIEAPEDMVKIIENEYSGRVVL